MKRIKLRELLNLTEQAPQPPPMPGAPTVPQTATPAPTTPESPSPEDPGEYDFTKDFRSFETSVEKAKQAAKKKFLDKLNQTVKGKKVTVNASRGFGQPQKDYTIDKVLKASVDWAYNKNVVTLSDENEKEYILTPGVNIKIEQSISEPETVPDGSKEDGATKQSVSSPVNKPSETPSTVSADQGDQSSSVGNQNPTPPPVSQGGEEKQEVPNQQNPEQDKNAELDALKKKKKLSQPAPVSEELSDEEEEKNKMDKDSIQDSVAEVFAGFIPNSHGRFDVKPFIKKSSSERGREDGGWSAEYTIEIPSDLFGGLLDEREFKLEVSNRLRHYSGPGLSFSKGGVDIKRHGRYYVFEFWENGGLDI